MKVQSSTIAEIDREVVEGELYLKVTFKHGGEYLYEGVPAQVYEDFLMSESKGRFLREHIVGKYKYAKVR